MGNRDEEVSNDLQAECTKLSTSLFYLGTIEQSWMSQQVMLYWVWAVSSLSNTSNNEVGIMLPIMSCMSHNRRLCAQRSITSSSCLLLTSRITTCNCHCFCPSWRMMLEDVEDFGHQIFTQAWNKCRQIFSLRAFSWVLRRFFYNSLKKHFCQWIQSMSTCHTSLLL